MDEFETYTLPISGKEVIVRGYVTGLIDREIRKIQAKAMSFEVDASKIDGVAELNTATFPPGTIVRLDSEAQINAEDKLLELMVSSLDGNTGDVFNRLMALSAQDVDFVTEKVNAIKAASQVAGADPKAPTS